MRGYLCFLYAPHIRYKENHEDSEKENIQAELRVYVNEDEEIKFMCNWEPSEKGIDGISSIFFGLAYNDLAEQILNHLKNQCVLESNEEDFVRIIDTIKSFIISQDKELQDIESNESLAVTPRNILRL